MTVVVNILNKQRRFCLDLDGLGETLAHLSTVALNELSTRPARWLKPSVLSDFAERGELSLVLVSNRKIRVLNREWRGKDHATDVLSFPLAVADDRSIDVMPGDEVIELGELIISLEKVAQQAQEYGHSFERELAFLFVHGFLHVLGFDHVTKAQELDMFGRQTRILNSAGFPRQ